MSALPPAPLWKRLAAGLYDLLPLAALLMLATFALLPLTGGEGMPRRGPGHHAYQSFMGLLIALYYVWSWHRGGQTIGMRAWRLRVQTDAAERPALGTALLRFAFSLIAITAFGVGLLWSLYDPRKRMWQDIWTGTEVVCVPKR